MGQNIYVFEVKLNLAGTDQEYKTLHFLGYNVFQVSHIAFEYIYDSDSEFEADVPVDIGSIKKVPGIQNICNELFALDMMDDEHDHEEYDGKSLIKAAENMPDEAVMEFKCSCHEKLRVPQGMWPFLVCPNCQNKIFRREIKDIGGIYIYEKMDNGKK